MKNKGYRKIQAYQCIECEELHDNAIDAHNCCLGYGQKENMTLKTDSRGCYGNVSMNPNHRY